MAGNGQRPTAREQIAEALRRAGRFGLTRDQLLMALETDHTVKEQAVMSGDCFNVQVYKARRAGLAIECVTIYRLVR